MDDVKNLHDRATRGEVLSLPEQELLQVWYSDQDAAEAENLKGERTEVGRSVKEGIDATLARITEVTSRIQAIGADNETIRRENELLRIQLSQRSTPQRA